MKVLSIAETVDTTLDLSELMTFTKISIRHFKRVAIDLHVWPEFFFYESDIHQQATKNSL